MYNEVKVADQVEEIDTGAFLFTPRVFMIELRGLRADVPSFGIRSLVFVDELALPYPIDASRFCCRSEVRVRCAPRATCPCAPSSTPQCRKCCVSARAMAPPGLSSRSMRRG